RRALGWPGAGGGVRRLAGPFRVSRVDGSLGRLRGDAPFVVVGSAFGLPALVIGYPAVDGGDADAVLAGDLQVRPAALLPVLDGCFAFGFVVLLDGDAELAVAVAGDGAGVRVAVFAGDLSVRPEARELGSEPLLVPVQGKVAFLELFDAEPLD